METHIRTPFLAFATPQYLEVPLFQRPYVWQQEEQWEPLWEDVRRLADLRLASPQTEVQHFLGAIVLQLQTAGLGDLMTHQVIDGQQRLTTLQVLFDAAEGALTSRGQASLANRLRSFTHNDESFVRPGAPVLKLKHANKDGAAFIEVMNAESPVDYEALKHSRHRIVGAHSYFASAISEWLDEEGEERVPARAETLTHVLSNGLQMVVIALTPQENSQEIFETLNARGTPLTAADLIKNFVFQRLDVEGADTREAYDKVWPFDTKFWEQDVRPAATPCRVRRCSSTTGSRRARARRSAFRARSRASSPSWNMRRASRCSRCFTRSVSRPSSTVPGRRRRSPSTAT